MIYDKKRHNLKHPQGLVDFEERCEFYIKEGYTVELGIYKHTRSSLQNRSLHKYFDLIAKSLNEAGYYYSRPSVMTGEIIEVPFNEEIIKESLWREIQMTLFNIKSTTKLTSRMINEIIDVITNWLAAKGIQVDFPNRNELLKNVK